MNIFNSLGSNYDLRFVTQALLSGDSPNYSDKLKTLLEDKYQGKVILVYKARQAIELALRLLNLPKDSQVAINGFICYAVYQAIVKSGYKVECLDLENSDLNFSADKFKAKLRQNSKIKVLIVQNTLGYPVDIEKIAKICQENKIILIEDLAHSVGLVYKNNQAAGTVGDFTILSFSQDKMIDAISGGALIIREGNFEISNLNFESPELNQQLRDRFYPFFTYIIRTSYQIKIGKLTHFLLKRLNLLANPMGNQIDEKIHQLPNWYANLALLSFRDLENNLKHRRQIAAIYAQNLDPKVLSKPLLPQVSNSTNLRFPIFVKAREDLIQYLEKSGLYVSDIWYDAPIAPQKYMKLATYQGQCPVSENVSSQILNLPTHRNISIREAKEICERINQWLKLQ